MRRSQERQCPPRARVLDGRRVRDLCGSHPYSNTNSFSLSSRLSLSTACHRRSSAARRSAPSAIYPVCPSAKQAPYTLGIWDRLTRFVDDARIPLDNNATERAIRGPVVGPKNHYGSRSRRGTQVAATVYSLPETAKLHGIDPAAYLLAAVRAADRGEALLPWQYAPRSDAR
jgi:hypothetical protein